MNLHINICTTQTGGLFVQDGGHEALFADLKEPLQIKEVYSYETHLPKRLHEVQTKHTALQPIELFKRQFTRSHLQPSIQLNCGSRLLYSPTLLCTNSQT